MGRALGWVATRVTEWVRASQSKDGALVLPSHLRDAVNAVAVILRPHQFAACTGEATRTQRGYRLRAYDS